MVQHLDAAKNRQALYYDNGKRVDVFYQAGDLVWLSHKFIKTRRPSQKLDYRRIGPFPVIRMIGKNAVKLALPKEYARIHPVFNVALVMPFRDNSSRLTGDFAPEVLHSQVEDSSTRDIACWISVELILNHRFFNYEHQYLLRMEATGINDTWVSLRHISRGLDNFIHAFHKIHTHLRRPQWDVFEDPLRPDVGYLADA